jgi:hypothetical integral membrane protein (TIGR02206 family)
MYCSESATGRLMLTGRIVTLLIIATLGCMIVLACRRWPEARRVWLGRVLALSLIACAATAYLQLAVTGDLNASFALPLQVCDAVMLACVISLLRPNRFASEVAYFCGFAGTLQAAITPDIGRKFPSWEYIEFFWAHGGVLLAVVFLIAGQGFRPRAGSMWRMFFAVNIYAVVVGALDAAFSWNYGYLCEKPVYPSLMDYLGPWPWYILSLEAVALASFWLLDLPWRIARRRAGSAQAEDPGNSLSV